MPMATGVSRPASPERGSASSISSDALLTAASPQFRNTAVSASRSSVASASTGVASAENPYAAAEAAGADVVGSDDLIMDVSKGVIDFDRSGV